MWKNARHARWKQGDEGRRGRPTVTLRPPQNGANPSHNVGTSASRMLDSPLVFKHLPRQGVHGRGELVGMAEHDLVPRAPDDPFRRIAQILAGSHEVPAGDVLRSPMMELGTEID